MIQSYKLLLNFCSLAGRIPGYQQGQKPAGLIQTAHEMLLDLHPDQVVAWKAQSRKGAMAGLSGE